MFEGIILTHHIITSYFTIINPFHVSISRIILHLHFMHHSHYHSSSSFHAPFSLSFFIFISCTILIIILQLHFMHHSHYHSSTPFSCIIHLIILHLHFSSHHFSHQKIFLIIHFSPSSHHHLNTAPRHLIEFRLVKNIDTLIS